MIYFWSDSHFGHEKILTACNRPFSSVEEMDDKLIENYQRVVRPNDTVYFLGDFCWDAEKGLKIWQRLNGTKVFIEGNHDKKFGEVLVYEKHKIFELHHNKTIITMCHYPMVCWNRSHFNAPMLFAHVHGGKIPIKGKMWDVGVDNNNFTPVSLDFIMSKMETLPNNWNYIERGKK